MRLVGSSLLIMGLAGGALIPLLFGQLVDIFHHVWRIVFWCPVTHIFIILLYPVIESEPYEGSIKTRLRIVL